MLKSEIEVGETYYFVGSDSPTRKHLAGLPFKVVKKERVFRKQAYRRGKRAGTVKVLRFFNDDGIGARAEELEPLPKEGFFYCKTCEQWYPDYATHSNLPILPDGTAGQAFTTCSECGEQVEPATAE